MKRAKPLFRFVGELTDGYRLEVQFTTAQRAQDFFFALSDGGFAGQTREVNQRFADYILEVREELRTAGVVVDEPLWFAELFR